MARLRIDGELHVWRNWVVVAWRSMTKKYLVDDRVAIDRMLQRQSDVSVIERSHRDIHGNDVMTIAHYLGYVDSRRLLQEIEGLEIAPIHVVDFAGCQSGGASGDIRDGGDLGLLKPEIPIIILIL